MIPQGVVQHLVAEWEKECEGGGEVKENTLVEEIADPKELAKSYLRRAEKKLHEAKGHAKKYDEWPEAISSSHECMEFSIKAIFLLALGQHRKGHGFSIDVLIPVFKEMPKEKRDPKFWRLALISSFWEGFYTVAKYGYEHLGVGAEKLFGKDEGQLAMKHAGECYDAAKSLAYEKGLSYWWQHDPPLHHLGKRTRASSAWWGRVVQKKTTVGTGVTPEKASARR